MRRTVIYPIEEITAGMMVYVHNPDTGETTLKKWYGVLCYVKRMCKKSCGTMYENKIWI